MTPTETSETVEGRFQRWTDRLTDIVSRMDEEAWKAALNEMWKEDKTLAVWHENCIDGCCPTGNLVLLRLVHPQVNAGWMVSTFPELIKSSQTHRAVIGTEDDEENE